MSESGSQLDPEQMRSTANMCEGAGEDLGVKLQELMIQLGPMESHLQGVAGKTFQKVKETLYNHVRNINSNLDDIAQLIRETGDLSEAEDIDSDATLREAVEGVEGVDETSQLTSGK